MPRVELFREKVQGEIALWVISWGDYSGVVVLDAKAQGGNNTGGIS